MAGLQKTRTIAGFTSYLIGSERFLTKEDALKRIQGILYAYDLNQRVSEADAQFLLALLQYHQRASEKVGCGVAGFEVRQNPRFPKQRGFMIIRTDGSEIDFSFLKCLTPPSPKTLFLDVCRLAVAEHIIAYKANYFSKHQNEQGQVLCPVTGEWITRDQAHVDHLPPSVFAVLVENFLSTRLLNLEDVELSEAASDDIGWVFADAALAGEWCAYHKAHARLRIVSAWANLSLVPQAYNRAPRQLTLFEAGLFGSPAL